MEADPVLNCRPEALREAVIRHVLQTPGREAELVRQTQAQLTVPEEFVVFCPCENSTSCRMWNRYAQDGRGFVIEFNTLHPGFALLRTPGIVGKVEYSDAPIPSFLSAYGVSAFFQKREQYRYEAEWRSIRAKGRFKNIIRPENGPAIYLSPFSPACVKEILILHECSVEWELRTLAAVDARYRHVAVTTCALR
jgi:hypothetical protein